MSVKIVPSMTKADFANLGRECVGLQDARVDRIHWDIMDGHFVPNITFGPDVVAACRKVCTVGFEAHIMCERPEGLLPRYAEAGCELVTVHPESLRQPYRTYTAIREMGLRLGIALSPATPLDQLDHVLDLVDLVLVMTVCPGFGGQPYLRAMEPKVRAVRELITASELAVDLEVDGGIGPDTIGGAAAAGADVFVAGSALWSYGSFDAGVSDLRARAETARAG